MSEPLSTASSASLLAMSPRSMKLSRVNSTTGSFTQRSLQSFRTVSLPGLLSGAALGILASGYLDKRRDGAVRGGWAKRLFILSSRSLHYYRKSEEFELFGKERGQVPLSEIALAKLVSADDAPYGAVEAGVPSCFFAVLSKRKALLLFLRAESLELAQGWVTTINRAVHLAKTLRFAQWPIESVQKFTASASANFVEEEVSNEHSDAVTPGDITKIEKIEVEEQDHDIESMNSPSSEKEPADAEKGDEEKGRQRYENTLQWRKELDIDNLLIKPHQTFETIKKYYPQYFHGRSKSGSPVYYEQPGKIDLAGLKREGLSIEDLLHHYMYITEYLWRVIEPSDTGRSVTVLDVSGIGMSDLGGEVLDFIKRASAFTGAHYPERSAHIFIINIPGWFNMIWRMIKPLIDPVTREKIHMLKGSAILKELETLIDADDIPSDLGGHMPVTFEDVSTATFRIRDGIQQTSCKYSPMLSHNMGYELYLKKDYRQMTGSFKERGARNALLRLTPEQKKNGVVAASAVGNHALALAYHGKLLGIPVTCVMPNIAPLTKITSCQDLGARVVLHGSHILEAREKADEFARDENLVYINGFDHPDIIAGAGTMGIEILNQVPNVDAIIVPVGGGGLIAGIALAVKTLAPNVQVIGVEPELCPSYSGALDAGKPVHVPTAPTLADGLAVPCVGANAFQVARHRVDKVVTVSERAIALSVLRLVEQEKVVVEGGGACSLAALIDNKLPELRGKRVVLPLCGGNIDIPVLGRVIERGLAADGRLVRFVATVSDRPGGIAQLANLLWECGVSVKDIYHERAWVHTSVSQVAVKCVVETQSYEHGMELKRRLEAEGYPLQWSSAKDPLIEA
ncbi:hypothetical protein P43SY_001073 [Pythium insidiosum]|uniref:Threonine ammonia-lyase n=1 Tax=Pythium insidiosum TaxID=114742 RepID=A0AAD5M774_PYTIN|nr:hypothetical protein P43SY_001073 [Pythium insidiosum]